MNFMNALNTAISQSLVTRLLANVFIFVLLATAVGVVATEIIRGQPINQIAYSLVFTGVGYALHVLGLNQGVTLEPLGQMKTTEATVTMAPAQAPGDEITTKIAKVSVKDGTSNTTIASS